MFSLKPPVLKKKVDTTFIPFPIYNDDRTIVNPWPKFHGILGQQTVIIKNLNEIAHLNNKGCFGQSTLPHQNICSSYRLCKNKTIKCKTNWKSMQLIPFNFSENCNDIYDEIGNNDVNIPTNWKDLKDNFPDKLQSLEILSGQKKDGIYYLQLEEAFFLLHTLECLEIKNEDNTVFNEDECWRIFSSLKPSFPFLYAAYHYYRSKEWVVKSGIQYGGDFVLYKISPVYYHSSYVVIIDINGHKTKLSSWSEMLGCVRMTEAASKDLLLCTIVGPTFEESNTIDMSKYTIKETIIKRWVPAQNRKNI
ncbi:uncharacterized protein LOC126907280 [Daktulosphaira vitifoliae]|uniref:uncharacterized protein LOC126907280 n=1 Tax=Daktulosphaira vitifoliae TaxID=58002 RepID=UPI0021AA4107|nr:uncharacterized protein LOC126907280 [Daktulosphaira vitifoliae]